MCNDMCFLSSLALLQSLTGILNSTHLTIISLLSPACHLKQTSLRQDLRSLPGKLRKTIIIPLLLFHFQVFEQLQNNRLPFSLSVASGLLGLHKRHTVSLY